MYLYHGTSKKFVNDLTSGKIDVTKGGGEFGQGFYTGNSAHLVAAWAWQKYGDIMAVISYNIDDIRFARLRIVNLTKHIASQVRSSIKQQSKKRSLYFTESDVVVGPVVGQPYSGYFQIVFVGDIGQRFINGEQSCKLWKKQ